jgi:hypothetical protein
MAHPQSATVSWWEKEEVVASEIPLLTLHISHLSGGRGYPCVPIVAEDTS